LSRLAGIWLAGWAASPCNHRSGSGRPCTFIHSEVNDVRRAWLARLSPLSLENKRGTPSLCSLHSSNLHALRHGHQHRRDPSPRKGGKHMLPPIDDGVLLWLRQYHRHQLARSLLALQHLLQLWRRRRGSCPPLPLRRRGILHWSSDENSRTTTCGVSPGDLYRHSAVFTSPSHLVITSHPAVLLLAPVAFLELLSCTDWCGCCAGRHTPVALFPAFCSLACRWLSWSPVTAWLQTSGSTTDGRLLGLTEGWLNGGRATRRRFLERCVTCKRLGGR